MSIRNCMILAAIAAALANGAAAQAPAQGPARAPAQTPAQAPVKAPATNAPPTAEQIQAEIAIMESQLSATRARAERRTARIEELDQEVEQQVGELLNLLKSVTDSTESNTEVANAKLKVMQGLRRSIDYYVQQRAKRQEELKATYPKLKPEDLKSDVDALNEKIDQRIGQIIEITGSIAKHDDFQKYEYYTEDYGWGYSDTKKVVRDEYKQSRNEGRKADEAVEDVADALAKGIRALDARNATLKNQMAYGTEKQQAAMKEEIARNEELLKSRREQLQKIVTQPSQTGRPVGDREADTVEQVIRTSAAGIRADWQEMTQLQNALLVDRSKTKSLELRIDYLKKMLDRTQTPAAPASS
jgi:chromosome segregation ATPase